MYNTNIWKLILIVLVIGCSCSEKYEGQEVYKHNSSELAQGPEFKQSKLNVVTLHKDQVQRRDFNGIFDIKPSGTTIVRSYWRQKFVELTRSDWYGDFFIEYDEEKSKLAGAFPKDTRQKEITLRDLDNSFHNLCLALGIDKEYKKYKTQKLGD